ncbi:hypothetical protein NEPAR06_1717 [Nematocida parisii]|nr:hypothetical protein NEPAR08_1718 [Nematocida parisii]KAI5140842.1 hypothetical protein NEPAR04_0559 [Nematocida parisii]KAI5155311.1 hypothetical protein NEPAR06_1717 [Nematocida parisii]KAI5158010.1 hypothetical protein NEPAR05_1784 [Nematocida parisii]
MTIQPEAEYHIPEKFIFAAGPLFITHTTKDNRSCVQIYKYPNVYLQCFLFRTSVYESDIDIIIDKEKSSIRITNNVDREVYIHSIQNIMPLFEEVYSDVGVSVRNGAYTKGVCTPTVYIHGCRVFSIESKEVEEFYYNTEQMKLYTYSPKISAITEYTLFTVERIYPRGICFISPEHASVYLPEKKYTIPIEYSPASSISFFYNNQTLRHILSCDGLIMYRNQFKRYPNDFIPSGVWKKHLYIYLFSAEKKRLLVLNSNLEIEFDMAASQVFVTDDYIFISKKENTVAHHIKTFKFAFILPGFVISNDVVSIEEIGEILLVFTTEKIIKQTTPLFSLFITEININTKEIKEFTAVPQKEFFITQTQCINLFKLSLEKEKPHIITGIQNISIAKKGSNYVAFGISGNNILFFWMDNMASVSIEFIKKPFAIEKDSKKEEELLAGLAAWIDPITGTLYTVRECLYKESIFPIIILLCTRNILPFSLAFDIFSNSAEYKTSVERTLFHFLHIDEIELAIDLLDAVKTYAPHTYEEIVSVMVRLLDEKNTKKLYHIIDPEEISGFICAESLSRLILQDFSLFKRFVSSAVLQKKEHLVYNFVEFAYKIDDKQLHSHMLSCLLDNTMLYLSGMLLSKIDRNSSIDTHVDAEELVNTYKKTNHLIEQIKDTQEPAEILKDIFTGTDALLISMISEKLYIIKSAP